MFPQELGTYLQELKSAWTKATLSNESADLLALLDHPFRSAHPLSQEFLSLNANGLDLDHLTFAELCQLALVRSSYDNGSLGKALQPFTDFPTLWSYEDRFHLKETKDAIALLLHVFGKANLPENSSPYFQALVKKASIKEERRESLQLAKRLDFGAVASAFICHGKGVALGAMKCKEIAIPAFGPHLYPLNDSKHFGVDIDQNSSWGCLTADKEIWFEHKAMASSNGFETRFFGIKPKQSVFFVFYVQASRATICEKTFSPKTLQRFSKEADSVSFERESSALQIKSTSTCKIELIPLASDASFWGSDFLLAFEIPCFDGRIGFQFETN